MGCFGCIHIFNMISHLLKYIHDSSTIGKATDSCGLKMRYRLMNASNCVHMLRFSE